MTRSRGTAAAMLREIYAVVLARCEPGAILREAARDGRVAVPSGAGSIVSLGKCAVPLAVAAAELTGLARGLVVHPEGYGDETQLPSGFVRAIGSHPVPTQKSGDAARRAIEFVSAQRDPILFLVSGGASACLEDGLAPHVTLDDLARLNEILLRSGLAIGSINTVRRHLSAVKGGRLGLMAPPGSATLVYSDVPPGRPELVGSGPTAADPTTRSDAVDILRRLEGVLPGRLADLLSSGAIPETPKDPPTRMQVIADSDALLDPAERECRAWGLDARRSSPIDGEVADVAGRLAREAAVLGESEILVAAGEPTVVVAGDGRGGRCTELAARFTLECDALGVHDTCALFGSSDGRDGSSPAAAVVVHPSHSPRLDRARATEALARSASYELVADFGEPVMMMPTGNNLRDIALVCRSR